jgi:glycosyltransferase involved in cell wall biosynthesis
MQSLTADANNRETERPACPSSIRIAVIFDRFGPYHVARLDAAGRRATITGIEVAEESAEYAWEKVIGSATYSRRTLFRGMTSRTLKRSQIDREMWRALDETKPDVVAVPGWSDRAGLSALVWSTRNRKPAIVMSASTELDADRQYIRESAKRQVVSLMSAGLAGGTRAADYLARLGLRRGRIFTGYDVVDNAHFNAGAQAARSRPEATRAGLALPQAYFLTCARFVQKKNLSALLKAYAHYRAGSEGAAWSLVLVGDGELKPALETEARDLGIARDVVFPGFADYQSLPAYYGLAGAFILPSSIEQWGLVVNEAMASGLPVLVSNRCGCAPDLVEDGVNGFTFAPYDIAGLASLLTKTARAVDLPRMGRASSAIIEHWSPDLFGENLLHAATAALEAGSPRRGPATSLILAGLRRL